MFKNITKFIFVTAITSLLLCTSCNDFDDMNSNPTKSDKIDPNSQLAYVQLLTWGDWMTCEPYMYYSASMVQIMQGDWNTTNYGGQYRRNNAMLGQAWSRIYGLSIKNLADVLHNTKDKPEYVNVRSVARIFNVYCSMLLTDMYGDIPYFEAGKVQSENISNPSYNRQEVIYKDFLKELKEVEAALDTEGDAVSGDIIYNGDIGKWKRFANSLHLRLAMRLTKVDPDLARDEVVSIMETTSGVLTAADNALVKYTDLNDWTSGEMRRNSISQLFRGRETYPTPYLSSTFWNYMKTTSDPRLLRIGRGYDETPSSANNPFGRIDLTSEILATAKGVDQFQPSDPGYFWYEKWPSGYYSSSTQKWQDKSCRPQMNNAFLKGNVPGVIMTYPEVQFLLSEAKVRWGELISGATTAADYYRNGVTAAMKLLTEYGVDAISDAEIATYLTKNSFPATVSGQLKTINEQLWVLHFNNAPEAYSNWRRSGYPALKSSLEYGALTIESKTIPRRFNYPLSEGSYNKDAYNAALDAMGGRDDWNARVWWDKE
jgi:hypothetical protein